ncbi:MAG: glycoside hydrolase family 2, partial [Ruminococcaceae bacterium]|nr:glycoside hydrolase family 2 [Oscillospiraceae bacterium]
MGGKPFMLTPWGEQLDRERVLQEYPRPQLRRDSYLNLNGLWHYAITPDAEQPAQWDGEILVPFSPESELSGAQRGPQPGEYLWYRRCVVLPEGFFRGRLLLQFGAVDQIATVFVNGTELFTHVGGFTPFTVDITDAYDGNALDITVRVLDTTDRGEQTRGKQTLNPGKIWYTAQSGIWQTVWLESVPERYIRGLRIIPRFDASALELWVAGEGMCHAEFGGSAFDFPAGQPAVLPVAALHPWSPEDPYLYDLTLQLGDDAVQSYFAMRKFSVETDAQGQKRLFLNGAPYFQNGLLDQGYWSDGLLTAPSDEALIFDIETAKRMGFNMLRKHIKLEPLRWYYHCDRLGMLVWQDMPNGGSRYRADIISLPLISGVHLRDDKY